jgi:Ankyrin repeats (3 copies)
MLLAIALAGAGCLQRSRSAEVPLGELLQAAKAGDTARARRLLQAEPGLARASWEGAASGPVRTAAEAGQVEMLRLLLESGADPRERDLSALTPLHQAKTPEIARLLIEHGSPADVRSYNGETPLMTRAEAPELVELLLEAGAHPNLRAADGRTALHHALFNGRRSALRVVALLCAYGADPRIRDEKGESPADLAHGSATEGVGDRVLARALSQFLAPGGGCEALRSRPAGSAPVSKAEREAATRAALCGAGEASACGGAEP